MILEDPTLHIFPEENIEYNQEMLSSILSTPTPANHRRQMRIHHSNSNNAYLRDKNLLKWFSTQQYMAALENAQLNFGELERVFKPDGTFSHSLCCVEFTGPAFLLRVLQYVLTRFGTVSARLGPARSELAHDDRNRPIERLHWTLQFNSTCSQFMKMFRLELLDMLLRVGNYNDLFPLVDRFVCG